MTTTKPPLETARELVCAVAKPGLPTAYIMHAAIVTLRHTAAPGMPQPGDYTTDQIAHVIDLTARVMGIEATEYTAEVVGKVLTEANTMPKPEALAVSAELERQFTGH